jgi:catechol 2,3-dioxygenase-like lactoylglutathione lyase family enzyme
MDITGVDFTMVATQDFERAVDFYENTLGLQKSKQWGTMPGQEFETGNLTIAVWDPTAFGSEFAVNAQPIAFQVPDAKAAREELEGKGVTFDADTIDSGVCHMAFFRDPDGNGLMLHHRYAPQT